MFEFTVEISMPCDAEEPVLPPPQDDLLVQLLGELFLLVNIGTKFRSFTLLVDGAKTRATAHSSDENFEMVPPPRRLCTSLVPRFISIYGAGSQVLVHGQAWRVTAHEPLSADFANDALAVTVCCESLTKQPIKTLSEGASFLPDFYYSSSELMVQAASLVLLNRLFCKGESSLTLLIQNGVVHKRYQSGTFFKPKYETDDDLPITFGGGIVAFLLQQFGPESNVTIDGISRRLSASPIAIDKSLGIVGGVRLKF